MWENLPTEIQTRVAEDHLPFDTLCRFRSVSKSWSKPQIRPGLLSGLFIRRSLTKRSCRFSISDGARKRRLIHSSSLKSAADIRCLSCVNGLLTIVRGVREQVNFSVSNVFQCRSRWTDLPQSPRAPGKVAIFAGMSSLGLRLPRLGADADLGDYMFVVGMGGHVTELDRISNLVLQVYRGGMWSSSLFEFPVGHCLMYSYSGLKNGCGVLRGSVFYFLLMRLDKTSASLCCMDLLTSEKQCKVLCELERHVVHEWTVGNTVHPKLAVCSGKILLVYQHPLPLLKKAELTIGVQVFDEEQVAWRSLSVLPAEIRGRTRFSFQVYQPHRVICGGEELVVSDLGQVRDMRYNFATDTWSAIAKSHGDEVLPMS